MKCMKCQRTPTKALWCLIVGGCLCVAAGILFYYLPEVVDDIAALLLVLTQSSIIYPLWKDIPVPLYREFYMFNYTNYDDFVASCVQGVCTVKPEVVEVGPYSYREIRHKKTIKFDNSDQVSYRELHTFVFNKENSGKGLNYDDIVISPNIVLFSIPIILNNNGVIDGFYQNYTDTEGSKYSEGHKYLLADLSNQSQTDPFVTTRTVNELIYSGYVDELVLGGQVALLFREVLPGGVFAYFYGRNATDDSPYEIHTGSYEISDIFEITKWNNSEYLPLWSGGCNMINGSDGTMYSPRTSGQQDRVNIYVSDICRSIFLEYYDDTTFHGFKGSMYHSTLDLFADLNMNPDNGCFCQNNGSVCLGSGITFMGPCKFNAPIYLSHPHFYMTDYKFLDAIVGLDPQEDLHRSFLTIEKYSGMPISANIRFQLNVRMYPFIIEPIVVTIPDINFNNVSIGLKIDKTDLPEILLPVMWVDERAELDQPNIDLLNKDLYIPMRAVYGVVIVVLIISGLIAILGMTCTESIAFKYNKRKNELDGID